MRIEIFCQDEIAYILTDKNISIYPFTTLYSTLSVAWQLLQINHKVVHLDLVTTTDIKDDKHIYIFRMQHYHILVGLLQVIRRKCVHKVVKMLTICMIDNTFLKSRTQFIQLNSIIQLLSMKMTWSNQNFHSSSRSSQNHMKRQFMV